MPPLPSHLPPHRRCRALLGTLVAAGLAAGLAGCSVVDRRAHLPLPPGEVILTFDDGPNPDDDTTRRLLDVLAEHDVRAAFCLVGRQVDRHPDLAREIHQRGHLIVNHSYHHHFPLLHGPDRISAEITLTDAALGVALGMPDYRSEAYRPPNGILTPATGRALRERGIASYYPITHFAWDTHARPENYHRVVSSIVADAVRRDGGVYLIHDHHSRLAGRPGGGRGTVADRSWVPAATAEIIVALRDGGLEFADPRRLLISPP